MSLDDRLTEEQIDRTDKTTRRKTKRTRELIGESEKQREALMKQHDALQRDLEEQQAEQKKLGVQSALGMAVNHRKFGKGKVTREDGRYIEVTFDKLTKTFVLPGAIAGGFLMPDDASLIEFYKKSAAIGDRMQKTDLKLRSNSFAMERIEEQLEALENRA